MSFRDVFSEWMSKEKRNEEFFGGGFWGCVSVRRTRHIFSLHSRVHTTKEQLIASIRVPTHHTTLSSSFEDVNSLNQIDNFLLQASTTAIALQSLWS